MRAITGGLLALSLLPTSTPADETTLHDQLTQLEHVTRLSSQVSSLKKGEAALVDKLLFKPGRNEPHERDLACIVALAQVLRQQLPARVRLDGWCDQDGSVAYNLELSKLRAQSIADQLVILGVPSQLIETRGKGSVPGGSATAPKPEDRRVDIWVERLKDSAESPAFSPPEPPEEAPDLSDLVELNPESNPLTLWLPEERLSGNSATIDFWLSADWSNTDKKSHWPDDESPCVLSLSDSGHCRLAVMIAQDKKSLLLWNGDDKSSVGIQANLSDGGLHHLAITSFDDRSYVSLDGRMLPQPVPVGLPGRPSTSLHLGALPEGDHRFHGKAGRVRLWRRGLLPGETSQLLALTQPPEITSSLFPDLVAELVVDPIIGPKLELPVIVHFPASAWWRPFGSDDVRLHNRQSFTAPISRPILHRSREELLDLGSVTGSNLHSSPPTYTLRRVEPTSPHSLVSAEARGWKADDPRGGRIESIRIWEDKILDGIQVSFTEPKGKGYLHGRTPWKADGLNISDGSTDIGFSSDENLIGITGLRLKKNRGLSQIRFLTNKRQYGPFGSETEGDPFEIHGFEGAAVGIQTISDGSLPPHAIGVSAPGLQYPGLLLTLHGGRSCRFKQIDRNVYQCLRAGLPFPNYDSKKLPSETGHPKLVMESGELLRIGGMKADFVSIEDRPQVKRKEAFNDTFVALSKASNLQANYNAYDIARMDPLHLVDSGTSKRIFAMPDGDSLYYQDYNHIFIPNEMIYVPEFTGEVQARTFTTSNMRSHQRHLSKTVGFDLGFEAFGGAEFSYSQTVSRARSRMAEHEKALTLGLAHATFYDLVLDLPRATLHPEFRQQIERLAETENYDQFVRVFGTHYPTAVIYGGLGVWQAEHDMESFQKMQNSSKETNVQFKAVLKGEGGGTTKAGTSTGSKSGTESQSSKKTSTNEESFYWVGGTHAGADQGSWSVGVEGAVPTYVALRPIEDLLVWPLFTDEAITGRVRQNLKRATDNYLEAAANWAKAHEPPTHYLFTFDLTALYMNGTSEVEDIVGKREFRPHSTLDPERANFIRFAHLNKENKTISENKTEFGGSYWLNVRMLEKQKVPARENLLNALQHQGKLEGDLSRQAGLTKRELARIDFKKRILTKAKDQRFQWQVILTEEQIKSDKLVVAAKFHLDTKAKESKTFEVVPWKTLRHAGKDPLSFKATSGKYQWPGTVIMSNDIVNFTVNVNVEPLK